MLESQQVLFELNKVPELSADNQTIHTNREDSEICPPGTTPPGTGQGNPISVTGLMKAFNDQMTSTPKKGDTTTPALNISIGSEAGSKSDKTFGSEIRDSSNIQAPAPSTSNNDSLPPTPNKVAGNPSSEVDIPTTRITRSKALNMTTLMDSWTQALCVIEKMKSTPRGQFLFTHINVTVSDEAVKSHALTFDGTPDFYHLGADIFAIIGFPAAPMVYDQGQAIAMLQALKLLSSPVFFKAVFFNCKSLAPIFGNCLSVINQACKEAARDYLSLNVVATTPAPTISSPTQSRDSRSPYRSTQDQGALRQRSEERFRNNKDREERPRNNRNRSFSRNRNYARNGSQEARSYNDKGSYNDRGRNRSNSYQGSRDNKSDENNKSNSYRNNSRSRSDQESKRSSSTSDPSPHRNSAPKKLEIRVMNYRDQKCYPLVCDPSNCNPLECKKCKNGHASHNCAFYLYHSKTPCPNCKVLFHSKEECQLQAVIFPDASKNSKNV